MMPLWTTATLPSASRCGWALTSEGAPWVAQRVWAMPVVPLKRAGDLGFQVADPALGLDHLQG